MRKYLLTIFTCAALLACNSESSTNEPEDSKMDIQQEFILEGIWLLPSVTKEVPHYIRIESFGENYTGKFRGKDGNREEFNGTYDNGVFTMNVGSIKYEALVDEGTRTIKFNDQSYKHYDDCMQGKCSGDYSCTTDDGIKCEANIEVDDLYEIKVRFSTPLDTKIEDNNGPGSVVWQCDQVVFFPSENKLVPKPKKRNSHFEHGSLVFNADGNLEGMVCGKMVELVKK